MVNRRLITFYCRFLPGETIYFILVVYNLRRRLGGGGGSVARGNVAGDEGMPEPTVL